MKQANRSPVVVETLPNGLGVILQEDHTAPLISMWTWYRVGSRNETPGLTGVSHWVEHMQFKGTPTRAKGQIFRDVSRHGGILNALTSQDWTVYFETLAAEQIDLAIDIESDRMVNSLFDPAETASERTVILSERQGAENRPTYLLYEELVGAAFRAHPYGHSIIGFESDLKSITRDDLYHHYRQFYHPGNAFVVLVGDFDAAEMVQRIDQAFGSIPAGSAPPGVRVREPEQLGERRVELRRPAPTSYLQVAYHAPAASSPDAPAMLLADAVLSGGKGLGFGGGGLGRSSRLYKRLVSSGLARGAGSNFDLYVDPNLMTVAVTALPETEPARIEAAIDAEIERLRDSLVGDEELQRAKKQMKAQYTYSSEGVTNQAYRLGQMEMIDSYARAESLLSDIENVTADDIQRVANHYLRDANRTVGWLIPSERGSGSVPSREADADLAPDTTHFSRWGIGGPTADAPRQQFEQTTLPNGLTLLGQVRPQSPSVDVRIRLDGGAARDPISLSGLASFTARGMHRGTEAHTFEELNAISDSLGATIGIEAGRHHTDVGIRCLVEDLPVMIGLAAEIIQHPSFPANELETVRNQILSGIREADNDTVSRATRAFRQLVFPPPHPYGHRVAGELDTVARITREDLGRFHATQIGAERAVVAIVGGVTSFGAAVDLVARSFADWTGAAVSAEEIGYPPPPTARSDQRVAILGKSQADIVLGMPTVARTDPRYYALDLANLILGRLGLMGRLGASVRDKQGLAYYAASQLEPGLDGSLWLSRAGVDPENVDRTIDGILAELLRLRAEPVSNDELSDGKSYLTGVLPIALESNAGAVATLLNIHRYDLGLDYLDRYPSIVRALTRDEILDVVRATLDPDIVAIGVAGPPATAEGE